MYKYVNNEFNDIVWKIIKNEKILYILIEKDLCNRILTFIIKTLNSEQKDLIKKTINNFLYKDKSLKEKVLHLII